MKQNIIIEAIKDKDRKRIYDIVYQGERPEWKKWDAPYFDDYKFISYEEFEKSEMSFFFSDNVKGIYIDDVLEGTVSRYWEDRKTFWIEVGVIIYEKKKRYNGYGNKALKLWTSETFDKYPELEHIGLTTWSGNIPMMKCALKAGYKEEGRIRKVRYYNNEYYDSMKYGILREEMK